MPTSSSKSKDAEKEAADQHSQPDPKEKVKDHGGKYRLKTPTVLAFKVGGSEALPQWAQDAVDRGEIRPVGDDLHVINDFGTSVAHPGDWVMYDQIATIEVKPGDTFGANYEAVR